MADGKQDGSADVATGMGIMLVVLGACGYLVWWLWTEEILSALRWVRYGEMWVVSHFVDDDFVVAWGKEKYFLGVVRRHPESSRRESGYKKNKYYDNTGAHAVQMDCRRHYFPYRPLGYFQGSGHAVPATLQSGRAY